MYIYWTFPTEHQYISDHKVVSFEIFLISINTVVVVIPVFEVPVEIISAAIETCGYAIYLIYVKSKFGKFCLAYLDLIPEQLLSSRHKS